jgi:hypothetical protein
MLTSDLTTTCVLSAEGLPTRPAFSASTGGPEIEAMRGVWAEFQNHVLDWLGRMSASIAGPWRSSAKGRCPLVTR